MELDELLAQATCAVRDGSATDGGGDVKGTAWLVKDTGHLLTAGHVVQSISTEGVWVRFPDTDRDVWASSVVPPENNKSLAIDFAVLSLVENTRRQPLPFILASNVEGRVRARGYGSNLPNAQHGGTGTLLGHYKRDNDSAKYLFQYESFWATGTRSR